MPSDGLPYPIFAFAGLLPWQMFAFALTESTNSLVASQSVITKVYFPRLIVPLASIAVAVLDFGIAFTVLVAMMVVVRVGLRPAVAFLPLFLGLTILTAIAAGLWLSALNARYRDVRYAMPFLRRSGCSSARSRTGEPGPGEIPVALRSQSAGRTGGGIPLGPPRLSRAGARDDGGIGVRGAGLLAGGLVYFRKTERTIADVI